MKVMKIVLCLVYKENNKKWYFIKSINYDNNLSNYDKYDNFINIVFYTNFVVFEIPYVSK